MENCQLVRLHISCRIFLYVRYKILSKIEAKSSRHGGGVMVQPWCHGGVACWWMVSCYCTSPYGGTWRSVRCGPRMRISCPSRRRPWRRVRFLHCLSNVTSCNSNTNLQDKNLQWLKMIKFYKYNCFIHSWNILGNLRTRPLRLTSPCLSPLHLPITRCNNVTIVFFFWSSKTQSRWYLSAVVARWWFQAFFIFTPIWGRFSFYD